MAKQWPDYMGVYKGLVVESTVGKSTKGFPQFVIRVALTDYYDPKESKWFDVGDNGWTMNAYLCLYGRKPGVDPAATIQADDIEPNLNHQQVCKVFGWDGCGFGHLVNTDFTGKIIQVRVEPNDYDGAKAPCQICWVDVEDADPNSGLKKIDAKGLKDLETEFASLWGNQGGKKAATAAKPAAKKTAAPAAKKTEEEPPTKEDKKKTLQERSERLRKENAKAAAIPTLPPKKAKKAPVEETSKEEDAVPEGYDKKQAWCTCLELKSPHCTDEQLQASWEAAIAEIAPEGDEDNLDAAGWWAVKERVLADIGMF
jgi:hypothetical protein